MRKLKLGFLTLVIVVGLIVLDQQSAHASLPCNTGQVCTYWDTYYGGSMYYYTTPVGYCINIGEPWDNDISSIKNRTAFNVTFWTAGGCTGNLLLTLKIGPGSSASDLGGTLQNDAFSSLRIADGPILT